MRHAHLPLIAVTGKTVSFKLYVGNALSQHDAAKKGALPLASIFLRLLIAVPLCAEHLNPLETSITMLSESTRPVLLAMPA